MDGSYGIATAGEALDGSGKWLVNERWIDGSQHIEEFADMRTAFSWLFDEDRIRKTFMQCLVKLREEIQKEINGLCIR